MSWQRRNKPRARQSQKLPPAKRNKVIRRDKKLGRGCYFGYPNICTGLDGRIEVHHTIEVEDGGDDSLENLRAACHNCHTVYSAQQSQKRAVAAANEWKRKPERHPGVLD